MVIGLRSNDPLPRGRQRAPRDGRAMGRGRPEAKVGQDLRDHPSLLKESDDPHGSAAAGTDEGVHLVHLLDQTRPGALRRGGKESFRPSGPWTSWGWRWRTASWIANWCESSARAKSGHSRSACAPAPDPGVQAPASALTRQFAGGSVPPNAGLPRGAGSGSVVPPATSSRRWVLLARPWFPTS